MVIREAQYDELHEISKLYSDIDGDPDLENNIINEKWENILKYPFYKIYIVLDEKNSKIIGTFTLIICDNLGHGGRSFAIVENVVIHQDYRRIGIGKMMMEKAMEIASSKNCYKLMLSSDIKRKGAHIFYEKLGFEQHGISFKVNII